MPIRDMRFGRFLAGLAGVFAVMALLAGCASTTENSAPIGPDSAIPKISDSVVQGDTLQLSFPGATNLNGMFRVGPDGLVTLPYVGQVNVVGKTPATIKTELTELYKNQVNDPEVLVSIAGSANIVYVIGAVLRPGRVPLDRPMTVLEIIMEVGGYNPQTANLKKVTVIRYEGDKNVLYTLNLDPVLSGGQVPPFYVKPRDTIRVPEKVQWF